MIYLLPFCMIKLAPKAFPSIRPSVRPSAPDPVTNAVLEAFATWSSTNAEVQSFWTALTRLDLRIEPVHCLLGIFGRFRCTHKLQVVCLHNFIAAETQIDVVCQERMCLCCENVKTKRLFVCLHSAAKTIHSCTGLANLSIPRSQYRKSCNRSRVYTCWGSECKFHL